MQTIDNKYFCVAFNSSSDHRRIIKQYEKHDQECVDDCREQQQQQKKNSPNGITSR